MRNLLFPVFSLILLVSCSEKKSDKNFVLSGNIKGLKNGTLYIQRIKDTVLVPIDTITIDGDSHFTSAFNLDSPEMLYLFLDRGVTNSLDNNISFFAEKGNMNIETSLDYFTADAKITGSKNQALYEEYRKVISRYTDQNLSLVEKKFKAYKEGKLDAVAKMEKEQEGITLRRYLYTTNFAVNNGKYEVAPYVALAEIYDINLKYLDTIQKAMSPKVAQSLYGKKLNEFITQRQKAEK
ncbi:DUF4369 domain-containing protein [Flavobacterium sedimenticola]|uniref:DUF4369 domain-containing protein n=1 Tax=Flavobacterium sedimenticola TaxID=3043286 RepID=A0ABT6XRI5_9FLAO|nr:DUF4369 domain-containing protein [Flavobacterium sedimenticola]MDI9257610.1 DUF4369 domain-containing protein [Flavobacterium sedimenticola]